MQLLLNYKDQHYSEIQQKRRCKFAFAIKRDDGLQVMHKPVLCRDFLNDTLVWRSGERPFVDKSIYAYNYKGDVETEYTSLVIKDEKPLQDKDIKLLNKVEKELGLAKTLIAPTSDEKYVWVKGDKFWMRNTVLFSWYTAFLRALTYRNKPTKLETLKLDYKPEGFLQIPFLLADVDRGVTGAIEKEDMSLVHEHNGYVAATGKYTSRFNVYGDLLNAN